MTRHDVRKWLGTKSLGKMTRQEVYRHFQPGSLMAIVGNMHTFEECDEARDMALKMWDELHSGKRE